MCFSVSSVHPKLLNVNLLSAGRPARIDAPRVTLRTVPGTVPKVVLEGAWEPVFRATLRPVCPSNPTAIWRVCLGSSDIVTCRLTPTVSCGVTCTTTSVTARRATRRGVRTGTCEVNLTGSPGPPSPTPLGCPDATRCDDGPWMVRAAGGPLRRGRRSQQPQSERTKDEGQRTKHGRWKEQPERCQR
jgi:hypothetical protein